jgi:hypothetical protein
MKRIVSVMQSRSPLPRPLCILAVAVAIAGLAACVMLVEQAREGEPLDGHAGKSLVVSRLRFVHDGVEFFPWRMRLPAEQERHLWLLRFDSLAASFELWPEPDGTLAIWLAPGDYALVGNERRPKGPGFPGTPLALLRVRPDQRIAYAGDLVSSTSTAPEGFSAGRPMGDVRLELQPVERVREVLEQRHGALPEAPVVAPWCVGDDVQTLRNEAFATRGRQLLDQGCPTPR